MNDFIEQQLAVWPMARQNYLDLGKTQRHVFNLGPLPAAVQLNPARVRSTGARVDKKSIESRPCFLCAANRPKEQAVADFLPGWDVLLNPFPIFPVHFTIASRKHEPQAAMPLDMVTFVEHSPELVAFFNGAHAGASAPDHLHFQAVLKSELPLMNIVEKLHNAESTQIVRGSELAEGLPFDFYSMVIYPDSTGMKLLALAPAIYGQDADGNPDPGLVNSYVWKDARGVLRVIVIPRKTHRPSCYAEDADPHFVISPGAVDMAGVIVSVRNEDFDRIRPDDVLKIYREVAYTSLS